MNRIYSGTIVKQGNKTVSVELVSYYRHPKYQKVIKRTKKIKAHNEKFLLRIGEKVVIKADRPYSKTKRFLVIKKEEK